jgi:hypothetical protein
MFKFEYWYDVSDEEKKMIKELLGEEAVFDAELLVNGDELWHETLQQFVKFLSTCYGYDISPYVAVAKASEHVDISKWTGPVFDPNESL